MYELSQVVYQLSHFNILRSKFSKDNLKCIFCTTYLVYLVTMVYYIKLSTMGQILPLIQGSEGSYFFEVTLMPLLGIMLEFNRSFQTFTILSARK
jgi:hypothetical protein